MIIWGEKTKNHYHDGGLDIVLFKNFTNGLKKLIKIYQGQPTDVTFWTSRRETLFLERLTRVTDGLLNFWLESLHTFI